MVLFLTTLLRLSLFGSLLAVLLLLLRPLRRLSRRTAYYLWLLVLLRLCVPFGISLSVPVDAVPDVVAVSEGRLPPSAALPAERPAAGQADESTIAPEPEGSEEPLPPQVRRDWMALLTAPALWTALWGVGAAASVSWYMAGYLRFSRALRRSAQPASPQALAVLEAMDPGGQVRLVESPLADTPMLVGMLYPTVVLPLGVADEGRLRDILAHELTHARRYDLLYKWFAALVTSLHWFNPMMVLVRREISRACELSCDEAVLRTLDVQGRRHYGETLLELAAGPLPGPGFLAASLSEEKKLLKERLVSIVKYRNMGPAALFLALAAAALVGGCALISGAEAVESESSDGPEPTLLEDAVLYELDGATLAIPKDAADEVLVFPGDAGADGRTQHLVSVYEKRSYEESRNDWGDEGGAGFMFGIERYTRAQYEQHLMFDTGGVSAIAWDSESDTYYMQTTATDVQLYRSDIENYDEEAFEIWIDAMRSLRLMEIKDDFALRNGLEQYTDSIFFSKDYTYDSEHLCMLYQNDAYDLFQVLVLSQPVTQGSTGIWCVERWMDEYGNVYPVFPGEGTVTAADYYQDLQNQVDEGHRAGLLDPEDVALTWLDSYYDDGNDRLDIHLEEITALEGEPALKVWGIMNAMLSETLEHKGALEELTYIGGMEADVRIFEDPETENNPSDLSTWNPSLAMRAYSAISPKLWMKAEAPALEGNAVRFTAEDGSQIIFLEEGDLLCIRQDGGEEWFRPAYEDGGSNYAGMYAACEDWEAAVFPDVGSD